MRLGPLLAIAPALAACASKARPAPVDDGATQAPPPAADEPTREPGNPPLIAACRNGYFSGTAPVDIAPIDDGFVVISSRNERVHLATVDRQGRLKTARRAAIREKLTIPTLGDTAPVVTRDRHIHFTLVHPDARLFDVEIDRSGALVSSGVITPEGPHHTGPGARRADEILVLRLDERGSHQRFDWRQVLDDYDLRSGQRLATIDENCSMIDGIVATDWGFVADCARVTEKGRDAGPTAAEDYEHSILGIAGGKVIWELPLSREHFWPVLGTTGSQVLAIQDASPEARVHSNDTPHPVHAIRIDPTGKQVGEPMLGSGRVPEWWENLRLVWTGKEYAAIEVGAITRYDSHGRSLGTWRFEPDCSREYDDVRLVWTGQAYAVCGWYRTMLDLSDERHAQACKSLEDRIPLYPALVYDKAEGDRSAEILSK